MSDLKNYKILVVFAVLQIRRGNWENLMIISHILKNIFCDTSLEQSQRDGSDEESQHSCFS